MNIFTLLKKIYSSILLIEWSYLLIKCIQSIITHGIAPFSLFLDVLNPYVYIALSTLPFILILITKGKLQCILTVIHTLSIICIIYIIFKEKETIKNTFLLLLVFPLIFILLSLNEIFTSERFNKIIMNGLIICFPILLLSEFAFLSTSFLIVENKLLWFIVITIALLFVIQPGFIFTQTLPSIKEQIEEKKIS